MNHLLFTMSKRKWNYPTSSDKDTDPGTSTSNANDLSTPDVTPKSLGISPDDTATPLIPNYTFKRLFNQYITNTIKSPEVVPPSINATGTGTKSGNIYWHWFRIPIDDMRFFLTPRTTDLNINSNTEFKINYVK